MAPPTSSKASRMLGIPDFPPLSPQDATPPTQRRQSVASIDNGDDDDAQDHLSYASSEKTSAKSSFRMTVSTVASAAAAALVPPTTTNTTSNEGSGSRRRSHGDGAEHAQSAATSWPTFETQPRARVRPASPSPAIPSAPPPPAVAAILSSRPAAGSSGADTLALPDVVSDSDPLSPLPLSAFPLPPTTIPMPPPLPALAAHRTRPPSPLTATLPARRHPRPQRAQRRPSTADATIPGITPVANRSSVADSFYGASTSSPTTSQHAPSVWIDDARPSAPSGERTLPHPPLTAPLPPPSAPLPSAPAPPRPAAPSRRPPPGAPSGKAALLLGVGEPGRPATPDAHKKHQHRLLRKLIPRPHTADPDHRAPDFASNHTSRADHQHADNPTVAAKREAERLRHDAEVRRALHAFVYADPHPDWPPKAKKPKQAQSSAMKGRSGWW
ncbi:hypothetical protein FB107DRAFT_288831 [Schizophyllum commune]